MRRILSVVRMYLRWYVLGGLTFLSIILLLVVLHEDHGNKLTISFLNIGQGDSIFIESPTGTQVLIDGGPDKNLMKEISQVMPWYDRHIDMIFITNPDQDHYSGFIPLLDKYSVDVELEPGTVSKTETYKILQQKIKDKKVSQLIGRRGQVVDLGGGAYLQIIFPDRDVSGLSVNDGSLVMRLVYGDTSVALQGDSPNNIEHYLAGLDGGDLKSTILKAGHHGSKTSNSEEYIKKVSPEWAVISAGKDNKYGHPNQETLDTLNKLKIPYLATLAVGRINFVSNGKEFVRK